MSVLYWVTCLYNCHQNENEKQVKKLDGMEMFSFRPILNLPLFSVLTVSP